MSPLWPPVCKWNSQHSTGQEVIVVYSPSTPLYREHSGRFSSPSSLNGTVQPFLFSLTGFRNQLNLFLFFLAMELWGNSPRMSIPIIFCLLFHMSNNKRKQSAAALSSETDCCLVSLMCYLTNQAFKPPLFPSSGIESYKQTKAVAPIGCVTSPCQSSQPEFA